THGVAERMEEFLGRVAAWLGAAFSGAPSTDNLLFAYAMSLIGWSVGYIGGTGVMRAMNPWWAIVPSGAALLLNLSYAPPHLLPYVFVHLLASFGLLGHITSLMREERWRAQEVTETLNRGTSFALTGVGVGLIIIFAAWRIPVGEVQRGVASAWENVAGPWQTAQTNFDRLFAALNPSTVPGKGLTVAQTMAPRGSFELGDAPVLRISGREPGYWRAVTYDQYTGRAVISSPTMSQRLDRREPLEGSMETDASRKFAEYTVTVLAPSTSVIYAPDAPVTISVPTVYDYREDRHDYGSLRPLAPIHEQQRYSVLSSVSTASASELRQVGTAYPSWMHQYLQLPASLPDRVRREGRRVVGEASNSYDAALNVQQYLRGLTYSTRVPVPPPNRDWVSFLLFDSKEGYCDYFATAMMVMLRTVGIPARVASGYVTGDWDGATQSYIATEHHAHSWTEVYFPGYGWIAFEPSANRPAPVRPENQTASIGTDDLVSITQANPELDDYYDDEDELDAGSFVPLPPPQAGTGLILVRILLGVLLLSIVGGIGAIGILWRRGIRRLPAIARPYAQLVRLASWCRLGPRPSQTPFEFGRDLERVLPTAADRITAITDAYVAGVYGAKAHDESASRRLARIGMQTRRQLITAIVLGRWRRALSERLGAVAGTREWSDYRLRHVRWSTPYRTDLTEECVLAYHPRYSVSAPRSPFQGSADSGPYNLSALPLRRRNKAGR